MIQIDGLKKYYGKVPAVDGITFHVDDGEILGFLGPNGAGKSTTMKVITGFYPPTGGTVTVDGLDVVERSIETRQIIGYLPESNPLYYDFTVYEYLSFVAELRQIPVNKRRARIKEMIELTGLTDRIGQIIGELSKGYKQRVGLAQAMLHDPKILILDEPTIGLDPNQIVEIRSLIKAIGRRKTVILSTHILPEVQATCDRVVIINRGKLVADGTPGELQHKFQGMPVIQYDVIGASNDDIALFHSVSGIDQVERLADPEPNVLRFKMIAKPETDPRADLYKLAVQKGWTLVGLSRQIQSLENIFQQLTRTDEQHQHAEEAAA